MLYSPMVTALALNLMFHLYTARTEADPVFRLHYKSAAITDFGIAVGSADVKPQDRLAYTHLVDGRTETVIKGHDPNGHYWLYFTTTKNQKIRLDVSMYPHNFCMIVHADSYPMMNPSFPWAPVYYRDRVIERNTADFLKETKRVSILRNKEVHRLMEHATVLESAVITERFQDIMFDLMAKIAERPLSHSEKERTVTFICQQDVEFRRIAANRGWRQFPTVVPQGIDMDPDEMADLNDKKTESEWGRYIREWAKSN